MRRIHTALAALALLISAPALAQNWPNRAGGPAGGESPRHDGRAQTRRSGLPTAHLTDIKCMHGQVCNII